MTPKSRADRALETRRRMVQAAYELFACNGYSGTTIAAVATDARVAVPTIYYTFQTKAALFDEAIGAAIVGFDSWRQPPPEPSIGDLLTSHVWWPEFLAASTADETLAVFVTNSVDILDRVGPLASAMHGAAGDPEAAAVVRVAEQRQRQAYEHFAKELAAKPGGLTVPIKTATDILVALFSASVYQALADRGWTKKRCTAFLLDILRHQLTEQMVL